MSEVTIHFSGAYVGLPLSADDGDSVSATVPAGCVLRKSTDMLSWSVVGSTSFTHSGPHTSYRIDCDTYTVPVTAVLSITPA